MSAVLVSALFAILGTALVGVSVACWMLWKRVRALSATSDWTAGTVPSVVIEPRPSKLGHDLAERFQALEARLARVEGSIVISPRHVNRRVDRSETTLIAVPSLVSPSAPSSDAAAELDRRYGEVWAMADSGASIEAVSRDSGYPVGQIELILGLRRQLHGSSGTALDV